MSTEQLSRPGCPVCGATEQEAIVDRSCVPVFQNALYRTRDAAQAAPRGTLAMRRCRDCNFVWNAAFDPDRITYGTSYDNSQLNSDAFRAHLADRLARILQCLPARTDGPLEIVEVGCGQGDFLADLVSAIGTGRPVRAVGFDPAFRGDRVMPNGMSIEPAYFDAAACKRHGLAPDMLVSRHTIEHIADPIGFLTSMQESFAGGKPVRLFLETPDSAWILAHDAFHDFFYEHCSIFDFRSMAAALERAGFYSTRTECCFDGQYLWAEAEIAETRAIEDGGVDANLAGYVARWQRTIDGCEGPVALWGAGAKGATFALLMDPDGHRISCVVDRNRGKQGGFLPVSAHPIVAPSELEQEAVGTVLIVNPNYESEIRAEIAGLKLSPQIIVVD